MTTRLNSTTPLYQQIADQLREDITTGVYQPGDQIPGVKALARRYRISPQPARRAISELLAEGLVVVIPGDGTYVPVPKDAAE